MNQSDPLSSFGVKFLVLAGIAMNSLVISVFFGIQSTLSNGLREQREQSAAERRAFRDEVVDGLYQEGVTTP